MKYAKLFPMPLIFMFLILYIVLIVSCSKEIRKEFDDIKDKFVMIDDDVSSSLLLNDKLNNRVLRSNNFNNRGEEIFSIDNNHLNNKKRNKTRRSSCCGENDDLKLLWGDRNRDVKKECFEQAKIAIENNKKESRMEVEEYEGFVRGNRTKDEYICTVQCIGQKKEVLDHMGNVKKYEMWEYVKETYSSEPWKSDIADKVLEKCYNETQKPSEGEVTTDNGSVTNGRSIQAKCNSNGISFIHCLWREMQLNCPTEKLRDNRKCNRLRDRLRIQESSIKNGTTRSLF